MASDSTLRRGASRRSRRRSPAEARDEITRSARSFLVERPLRELTVGELMAGTTLSRPAFCLYCSDLNELLQALPEVVRQEIATVVNPWLAGEGEPREVLRESLRGLVDVCAEHGPLLRAVFEAAPFDERLERAWADFMGFCDDVACARIEAQQAAGLVAPFDARSLAHALNALDAAVLIEAFGLDQRADRERVLDSLHRIWHGALYGVAPAAPPRR
jgi:AcrR family transcriptional regulator